MACRNEQAGVRRYSDERVSEQTADLSFASESRSVAGAEDHIAGTLPDQARSLYNRVACVLRTHAVSNLLGRAALSILSGCCPVPSPPAPRYFSGRGKWNRSSSVHDQPHREADHRSQPAI